jgi:hypothetical protein
LRDIKLNKIIFYLKEYEKKVFNSEVRGELISISSIENQFNKLEPQLDQQLAERQRKMMESKAEQLLASQESETDNGNSPKILFIVNLKSKLMIDGKLKAILEPNKPNKITVNPGEFYMEIIPPFEESKKISEVLKSPERGEQAVKKYDFPLDLVETINMKLMATPSVFDRDLSDLAIMSKKNDVEKTDRTVTPSDDINAAILKTLTGRWVRNEGEKKASFKTLDFTANYEVFGDGSFYSYKLRISKNNISFNKLAWKGIPATVEIISKTEIAVTETYAVNKVIVRYTKE